MDRFVVGFAFNKKANSILLMKKDHPDWQKGLLNGIGGKIERGELPFDAMHRECKEETGLVLDWEGRGIMKGTNNDGHAFLCWIFYAYSEKIHKFKQIEKELLEVYSLAHVPYHSVVQNLNFLIPFGRSNDGALYLTLEY